MNAASLLPDIRTHSAPGLHRLAVMGGGYGNVPALRACLDRARDLGCDTYAFTGDITGCCGHSDEIVEMVRGHFPILVAGNHEQQSAACADHCACNYRVQDDTVAGSVGHRYSLQSLSDENRAWLGTLPELAVLETSAGRLLLCHGSPGQTNEFLYPSELDDARLAGWLDAADAVGFVGTHSGLPWVHWVEGGRRFAANCGVIGKPDHDGDPAVHFAVLEINGGGVFEVSIERVEYDHAAWVAQITGEGVEPVFTDPLLDGWWTIGLASLPPVERERRARPSDRFPRPA